VILRQLRDLLPRYRSLAETGRVELSMNPYAHPIVPLLLDMASAREAIPDVDLPAVTDYPGGRERVDYHIQRGLEVFERVFGHRPRGVWPSEGGLSQASLTAFAEHGFEWTASGGTVLHNSHPDSSTECAHRVFRFGDAGIDCFFRDDGLSDLIGFTYSDWHAEDAVANLISHMEEIAAVCPDHDNCLITIILDGENAWEHYPRNGHYFLNHLYREMLSHPRLRMNTFSGFLAELSPERQSAERLVAGSWVYGTFSTWIGDAAKNRAWELLLDAKRAFDRQVEAGALAPETVAAAQRQLAVCEGSDWFWWFGDYNPAPVVRRFDQLYRMHLANLYQLLKVEAPAYLTEVISRGGGTPAKGGVMRHHSDSGTPP